ncbi:MAG TPA: hypothetical protein VN452_02080 [Longilinea sp.]|nr:hypothetical protein [Longilinea sp.]
MSATTRERILEIIAQLRTVTVTELSHQLHTTVANIRYHLEPLLAEQIIERIQPDGTSSQRGRPASRFQLSEKYKPSDLPQLSSDLFSILMDTAKVPEDRIHMISQIALKRSEGVKTSGTATQRLNQVVSYLNRHAYRARWEARRTGPEIRFGNCPFALILPAHPELCEVDRSMIAELLNAQVSTLECYQPYTGIPAVCIFAIKSIKV